jgi:ribulose bisphosphate carboxylase small subunit
MNVTRIISLENDLEPYLSPEEKAYILEKEKTDEEIKVVIQELIEQGYITLDHLIKRKPNEKRGKDKGPLFKINSKGIGLLFPPSLKHQIAP